MPLCYSLGLNTLAPTTNTIPPEYGAANGYDLKPGTFNFEGSGLTNNVRIIIYLLLYSLGF